MLLNINSKYSLSSTNPAPLRNTREQGQPRCSDFKMVEHDALIGQYSHLNKLPREKEALLSLKKVASLVKPIMRARNWTVGTLAEFYPDQHNLLGKNRPWIDR